MGTTVQPFYAKRIEETNAQLIGQVEKLFLMGGISMPINLLAELFAEFSEQIRKPEEEGGFTRDFIADTVFHGTFLMECLAELYETSENLSSLKSKVEEAV